MKLKCAHKRTIRYTQKIESKVLKRYLYTHVHSRIIHNSKKWEATKATISDGMDTQNMVYTYKGILFNLKKERNSVTCYNMDETRGHYAKLNKPVTKRQIQYNSIYTRYLE